MKTRCPWGDSDEPLLKDYHDREWGVPVHDDLKHFELLILEGAQAGLSWSTVLRKREGYRRAFARFDPRRVAAFGKDKIEQLMEDPGLIRNRRKIESAVTNAKAFLRVQKEFKTFDLYIWSFVGATPVENMWRTQGQIPTVTNEAERMSADMVRRGFRFVGPTICYSYMQAVGMVNDHLVTCFRHSEVGR